MSKQPVQPVQPVTSQILREVRTIFQTNDLREAVNLSTYVYHRNKFEIALNHKPHLSRNHSLEDLEIYTSLFKDFKAQKEVNKEREQFNKALLQLVNAEVIEQGKQRLGFYSLVPKVAQQKVWDMAWSKGHAEGIYSAFMKLNELMDLFEGVKC